MLASIMAMTIVTKFTVFSEPLERVATTSLTMHGYTLDYLVTWSNSVI